MINCLENKRLIVRHVFKNTSVTLDKKHLLYGGMLDGATKKYSLPKNSAGVYVEVLTPDEEEFLESYMKVEPGTLSRFNRVNNYWDGLSVMLTKDDNYFNMSDPNDYIRIKILLCNKDYICPSLETLEKSPLATYEFVIVDSNEVDKVNKTKINSTMESYMQLGKIGEDPYKLKIVVEMLDKRESSSSSSVSALLNRANEHISENPKKFLEIVKDPYLNTKVLIRKAIDKKVIKNRGGLLYLTKDGSPLCDDGNPTMDVAARYLNLPKNAEIKLDLEMAVDEERNKVEETIAVSNDTTTKSGKKATTKDK